jgi:hypothetical protein
MYSPHYQQNKQQIIEQFWGAEEGIKMLENAILSRPAAAHPIREVNGFKIYQKPTAVTVYETFVYPEGKLTITYAVQNHTGEVVFMDIS